MKDPLGHTQWSAPEMVSGFAQSSPNQRLIQFAAEELRRVGSGAALDLGCGAARNTVPLARLGWRVLGVDLSWPMLQAAAQRVREQAPEARLSLALAPMDRIPAADAAFDLVVAHGIWNLARSGVEFRNAVAEAARVARPGAALFVFTFSRHTLAADAPPVAGEQFVFTQFSGQPQCFLTEEQLTGELRLAGFLPDPAIPLTEYNRSNSRTMHKSSAPVIYEAGFRYHG